MPLSTLLRMLGSNEGTPSPFETLAQSNSNQNPKPMIDPGYLPTRSHNRNFRVPPAPPAPPPTPSQIESRNQKRLSVIRHIDNRFNRIEELVVLNDKSIYLTDRGEWLNSLRSLKDQLDCSSVDPFTIFIPQAKAELSHQFAKDPVRLYHSLCAPFEQLEEFVKLNPSLLSPTMRPEWLQKFRKLKDQVTTTHAVKGAGILSA